MCDVTDGTVSINKLLRKNVLTTEVLLNLNWDKLIIPRELGEKDSESNVFYIDLGNGTAIQGRLILKDIKHFAGGVTITSTKPEVIKWLILKAR